MVDARSTAARALRLEPPDRAARELEGPAGLSAERVRELIQLHSHHPSIDLAFNAEMQYFTNPEQSALICYREGARVLYQFASPIGPEPLQDALLRDFIRFAEARRKRIFAVELRDEDVARYRRFGFRLNEMGRSYTLRVPEFSTAGNAFMRLRNKLKQPQKAKVQVLEVGRELPLDERLRARLEQITLEWLAAKGKHVKLIEFLVGETKSIERPGTRCFVAMREGEALAFITYVPAYGRCRGLMHDLTRRVPGCPAGTMEFINHAAIQRFQAEGIEHLNFGLTPFVGVDDRVEGHSRVVTWVMRTLAERGAAVYPAQAQVAYKLKWRPQIIAPEYMAYRGRFRIGYLLELLRLTRVIGG